VLTAYGDSLLQSDRVEDAVRYLRRAFTADTSDRNASLSLARAYIRQEDFRAALPLLEWQLAGDTDGSVHVLLSRALAGLGQTRRRSDAREIAGESSGRPAAGGRGGSNGRLRRRSRRDAKRRLLAITAP
jgi:predicted Zn-dependent protease